MGAVFDKICFLLVLLSQKDRLRAPEVQAGLPPFCITRRV